MSRRRQALLGALIVVLLLVHPPSRPSAEAPASVRMDPRLELAADRGIALVYHGDATLPGARVLRPRAAAGSLGSEVAILLVGDPDPSHLGALGFRLHTRAGRVWTARGPLEAVPRLRSIPGLERASLARPLVSHLDRSIPAVRADGLRTREGDFFSGLTGSGVIVGIVDSGLDPTHEDFLHPDGSTRVLFYWDQTDDGGPSPVSISGDTLYGSEWTAEDINSGASRAGDSNGHGTHVAGIAGGSGRGAAQDSLRYRYVGLAPRAGLIVVEADVFLEDGLLDAVSYVFRRAEELGMPAVVNLSLGSHFGPHDGTTSLELGLASLVGPGRLVVAAAGNSANDTLHAEIQVPAGGSDTVAVSVPPYEPGGGLNFFAVDGFYDGPASFTVTLLTPKGQQLGPYALGEIQGDTLTGEGTISLGHVPWSEETRQIALDVSDFDLDPGGPRPPPPGRGEWRVVVTDETTGGGGEVDLWIALTSIRSQDHRFPIWSRGWDPGEEVSSPGTGHAVLTVGAFNTKRCWTTLFGPERCTTVPEEQSAPGRVSHFSSRGGTRDGRQKPEIVAPGFVIASAFSEQMDAAWREAYGIEFTIDPDLAHFVNVGTSMAAPHLSGALALWLERTPGVDPDQARNRLRLTAHEDPDTAPPGWDPAAGFGKLDVAALLDSVQVPAHLRVLLLETGPEGRPRLRWEARPEDPVVLFRLESAEEEGGWQEQARFPGPGPHTWVDPQGQPGTVYRLWARLRGGETVLWARSRWGGESVRFWLGPPRPNPSAGVVRIPFRVSPSGAGTELGAVVLDLRGRRVRRLDPVRGEDSETGWLTWDGTTDAGHPVAAGVYWLRARMGGQPRVVRLVRVP